MLPFSAIVNRVPLSMKVKFALNSLGLENEDVTELDAIVKEVLGTPFVGVVTGKEFNSVSDVVSYGMDLVSGADGAMDKMAKLWPAVSPLLDNEAGRDKIARNLLKVVAASPKYAEKVALLLTKISRSPVFNGVEWKSGQHFVAEGVIPALTAILPKTPVHNHFECELCGHTQVT